ncbi:hypothetical protein N7495_006866 [Penicillium taxi]|uniref:uncharacterized protein n=1 Tax=Penicillium taxi TaxID=168475 RepID=UPI002545B2E3|nr:uncharacterized protein N7495_006866 [Penicillium taxi]KAJ5895175.1 hypothetical protein N7495_006866 [Penicillium taxi]
MARNSVSRAQLVTSVFHSTQLVSSDLVSNQPPATTYASDIEPAISESQGDNAEPVDQLSHLMSMVRLDIEALFPPDPVSSEERMRTIPLWAGLSLSRVEHDGCVASASPAL